MDKQRTYHKEELLIKTSNWQTRLERRLRIPVGLIGYGSISLNQHVPAILRDVPELELVAVAESDPNQRRTLERIYGGVRTYTNEVAMLDAERLVGVLIATETDSLPHLCSYAIKRGHHVFVEKPVARRAENIESLMRDVQGTGLICQVGFNRRFSYGYRIANELVRQGQLGEIHALNLRFWFAPPANLGDILEDLLLNVGIHAYDLAQYFMGTAIYSGVRARVTIGSQNGTLQALVPMKSGGSSTITLSSAGSWNYPSEYLEVIGDKSSVIVENSRRGKWLTPPDTVKCFEPSYSNHWVSCSTLLIAF